MVSGLSEYIVPAALLLLFVIYFFLGRFMTRGGMFAPWNVTLGVWSAIIIMMLLWGDLLYPIRGPFYIALACWVTGFFFASALVFKLTESKSPPQKQADFQVHRYVFYALLAVSILLTPMYFYRAYQSLNGDLSNIFVQLRENANDGSINVGLLKYVKELNSVLLIVSLWAYPKVSKWVVGYLVLINLMLGLAIMEKGSFFYIMIIVIFILYSKRVITLRTIAFTFAGFVAVAFLFNLLRSNIAFGSGNFFRFFSVYILSPSVAFEQLTPCSGDYWGSNTFPFFYYFVNFFTGESHEIVMKLKDFVAVPLPTNVFTVMQPYYVDFGYPGVFIFGIVNGGIFGWMYRKAVNHGPVAKCVYVYVLQILMLQFFQENFMVSMSVFLQICFWAYLLVGKRPLVLKYDSATE